MSLAWSMCVCVCVCVCWSVRALVGALVVGHMGVVAASRFERLGLVSSCVGGNCLRFF